MIYFYGMKNKLNIGKTIIIILPAVLLLASCASQSGRLPFIITAQYADRPVLIGQYKKPGEKIDPSASGVSFESLQGTAALGVPIGDFTINRLSRDILMLNPQKTDIVVIQRIKIKSYTTVVYSTYIFNESIVNGKIITEPAK